MNSDRGGTGTFLSFPAENCRTVTRRVARLRNEVDYCFHVSYFQLAKKNKGFMTQADEFPREHPRKLLGTNERWRRINSATLPLVAKNLNMLVNRLDARVPVRYRVHLDLCIAVHNCRLFLAGAR